MNIFASNPCPVKSGQALDDQRVVKMVLESCQILSTVAYLTGLWQPGYPKPTHMLHPCVLWAAAYQGNFDWLLEHAWSMDEERRCRWNRTAVHKTLQSCQDHKIQQVRKWLPRGQTDNVNCARNSQLGIDFTHEPDVHLAYRKYLRARWLHQARPAVCTIKGLYEDKNWRS